MKRSLEARTYMLRQRVSSVDGFFKPRFGLAMRWALNTGDALAYLHGLSHPIIHRDLKPLNMFLSRNLEAKGETEGVTRRQKYAEVIWCAEIP